MDIILRLGLIIILIVLLVKSADLLQDSFVSVSKRLAVNTFVTGFLVLSFASSLPELFVAINAASSNVPELSLGNLLGASIVLLSLVSALYVLKNGSINFEGIYGVKEVRFSLFIILTQLVTLIDGKLTWIEGVLLVLMYVSFAIYVIKKSQHEDVLIHRRTKNLSITFIKAIIGITGLILISNLLVNQAIFLANDLNINEILLGIVIFGFGTNLPEIMLLLRSNSEEKKSLAFGNFIGSATFNTMTLGILILMKPFVISDFQTLITSIFFLFLIIVIYMISSTTDSKITKREALILLGTFILFLIAELVINTR